eukprot:g81806.t1
MVVVTLFEEEIRKKGRPCKPVMVVETGEVFSSQTEAAKCMGVFQGDISRAIKRGVRSGGYHWKFVGDPDPVPVEVEQ